MDPLMVKIRDRRSIECKFLYLLTRIKTKDGEAADNRHRRRSIYDIEVHFYAPQSAHISPATYPREQLYTNIKSFLRFNTPHFTFSELRDTGLPHTPLNRMTAEVENDSVFNYEVRLIGCILKSLLRDSLAAVGRRSAAADSPAEASGAAGSGSSSGTATAGAAPGTGRTTQPAATPTGSPKVQRVGKTIRRMYLFVRFFHRYCAANRKLFQQHNRWATVQTVDELVSLLWEKTLVSVNNDSAYHASKKQVNDYLFKEQRYRARRGYPTAGLTESTGPRGREAYLARRKQLKTYVSSVLYITAKVSNSGKAIEHLLFSLAAGISMLVATGITLFSEQQYRDVTGALVVALVVGYMLKDRVKEVFRGVFKNLIGRRFYDKTTALFEPRYRRRFAVVKEQTYYTKADAAGRRPRAKGRRSPATDCRSPATDCRSPADLRSQAIHLVYHKQVRFADAQFNRMHHRVRGVADISIIDIRPFIDHLTDQVQPLPVFRENGSIEYAAVRRMYTLRVDVGCTTGDAAYRRTIHLDVNADGIQRVRVSA